LAKINPSAGRFAPSPTGPLHFGSLVAALGSFLDARASGGSWLVRIEDVDEPRTQAGAMEEILSTLEAYGFEWDGPLLRQSQRKDRYREVFEALIASGAVYACGCTRKEIADSALAIDGARIYPGTCRRGLAPGREARSFRVRAATQPIEFVDRVQGPIVQDVENEVGDFVLLRADGFFAYQLAVAVDDADQGVTDVVRGADLLDSTARQIHLQRLLGFPTPRYLHLPVAVNAQGEKLSKQTGARAAGPGSLPSAFEFLGHALPAHLRNAPCAEQLAWGIAHWDAGRIPKTRAIPVPAPEG
jgi:glutamyl-Q tRNA(Asp) synthetase